VGDTGGSGATGEPLPVVPTRVLVFGMARPDGTVRAADVYPVAESAGQSADQVRSCLRRLVKEGIYTREGDGREAVFHPTEAGFAMWDGSLNKHRLAYHQDQAGRGWDRRWHLVAFAVPEARRQARDRFRDLLRGLGGAPVQAGLFVSAHPWEDDVAKTATHLRLDGAVTTAMTDDLVVRGERDPRALASSLWDLEDLGSRYRMFVDRYAGVPEGLEEMRSRHERLSDADFMAGALGAVVDFQDCFLKDPLLPPELLPRPWPGREARALLAEVRKLGVLAREHHDRPQLFHAFDALLDMP
jgi:phenylacetic acid degradation operon negative regulatory protein